MKVVLFTQSSKSTYSVPIKLVLYKVTGLKKEIFSFDRFFPWTLSVPRCSQFSSSYALGKLFATRNR